MTVPHRVRLGLIGILAALMGALPARGDGDDFFQGMNTALNSQLIFVGTVKDDAGAHVSGALVTWRARMREVDGDQETSAGTYTDSIGRYRTLDVARIVHNAGLTFDPALVDITVSKPGYALIRRLRRTSDSQPMGLVEINFILTKTQAGPKE